MHQKLKSKNMKKKMGSLVLVTLSVTCFGFAAPVHSNPPVISIAFDQSFTSLVVDDNITIVLTNETGSEITVSGDQSQVKKIRAAVKKGSLYIWQPGGDKGEKVTVTIPAKQLRQVIVNGESYISTAATLDNTGLEVIVNGACKLVLHSRGNIDVTGTSDYEFKKG